MHAVLLLGQSIVFPTLVIQTQIQENLVCAIKKGEEKTTYFGNVSLSKVSFLVLRLYVEKDNVGVKNMSIETGTPPTQHAVKKIILTV